MGNKQGTRSKHNQRRDRKGIKHASREASRRATVKEKFLTARKLRRAKAEGK